jgi:hypothetical protein
MVVNRERSLVAAPKGFVQALFALGQPFGALSDLSKTMNVIFFLPLGEYLLADNYPQQPCLSALAKGIGFAGVTSAAVASCLTIYGCFDFRQSLPPVMAGFCRIGL